MGHYLSGEVELVRVRKVRRHKISDLPHGRARVRGDHLLDASYQVRLVGCMRHLVVNSKLRPPAAVADDVPGRRVVLPAAESARAGAAARAARDCGLGPFRARPA